MTVTSLAVKSVLTSLRVKVMVAVSPAARLVLLLLTMMVGGVVSLGPLLMVSARLLSASAPSWL